MDERKSPGTCAPKLVAETGTIKSMDVVLPVKRGATTAKLTVRTVACPERRVAELLAHLDLDLPTRNRVLAVALPASAEMLCRKSGAAGSPIRSLTHSGRATAEPGLSA